MKTFLLTVSLLILTMTLFNPASVSMKSYTEPQPLTSDEMIAYAESVPGSEVKIDMVAIAGGKFMMGSAAGEAGRAEDEGPQHEVAVGAFWMSATEITWDMYDQFAFSLDLKKEKAQDAPSRPASGVDAVTRPTPPYADEAFGYGKGSQPAISMTHHAAMEYCRWLSQKTGKTYRLPTEAEWEYASRAGTQTAYSFGDDSKRLGEYGWFLDNSEGGPRRVAQKKPNQWGLFDMYGNIAEWCLDHYDKDFYSTLKSPVVAPVLLPSDRRYPHTVRGGSWDDEAPLLRSAARRASGKSWSKRDPQSPQSIWWHTNAMMVGFRIVRPLTEQENLKGLRSKVTKQSE